MKENTNNTKNNDNKGKKESKQIRVQVMKKSFLERFVKNLGNITATCRAVGIERTAYYRWIKEDEDFKNKVNEIPEMAIDFAEAQLLKRMEEGSDTAIIFFLKCKAKHRGYVEKQIQEIEHTHPQIDLSKLTTEQIREMMKDDNKGTDKE